MFHTYHPLKKVHPMLSCVILLNFLLLLCVSFWLFGLYSWKYLSLLQSGSGCGVGVADGAAGPSRESQCVLGAPWPCNHRPLLGQQHPQSFCWWLGWQSVLSSRRILQTGQGTNSVCVSHIYYLPVTFCKEHIRVGRSTFYPRAFNKGEKHPPLFKCEVL